MSLPRHLRSYKEKSKDELARDFYNVPTQEEFSNGAKGSGLAKPRGQAGAEGLQGMDISAVLSVEGKEEVYVRATYPAATWLWK
jgi:hypothetical protein